MTDEELQQARFYAACGGRFGPTDARKACDVLYKLVDEVDRTRRALASAMKALEVGK